MKWLVDTVTISETTRPRPNAAVLRWFEGHEEWSWYVSVLTIGELHKGILRLAEGPRRTKLQQWLDVDLRKRCAGRILPVDVEIAETWGRLCAQAERLGRTLPAVDSLLAATALQHGLIVVTRNVEDFAAAGVTVENPWS